MATRFKYRHQYDEQADERARAATRIRDFGPSKTQQQYKDEVDLNVMVKRFGITDGAIPLPQYDPRYYGDFTDATDFKDSLDRIRDAEARFAALPAEIRKRFDNDPVALYYWVSDPKNADQAVELGLLKRTPPVSPPAKPEVPTGPGGTTPA